MQLQGLFSNFCTTSTGHHVYRMYTNKHRLIKMSEEEMRAVASMRAYRYAVMSTTLWRSVFACAAGVRTSMPLQRTPFPRLRVQLRRGRVSPRMWCGRTSRSLSLKKLTSPSLTPSHRRGRVSSSSQKTSTVLGWLELDLVSIHVPCLGSVVLHKDSML